MNGLLLDTHVWVWFLQDQPMLPAKVRRLIETRRRVCVSAVSTFEIGQKIRRGRWPGLE